MKFYIQESDFESLKETIPEDRHADLGATVDDDGAVTLDIDPENLESIFGADVTGLKKALKSERTASKEFERKWKDAQYKVNKFGDLDPDAIKESKAQIAADRQKLAGEKSDAMIRSEMQKSGVADFMFEHVKAQMQIDEKGNLIDSDGAPLLDAGGDAQTVETFVHGMRGDDKYKSVVRGTGHSGSDAHPAHIKPRDIGGSAVSVNQNRSQMSSKEKVAYIRAHGNEKFQNLPL